MRVLVTGDRGKVGIPVARHLRRRGYKVAGFDIADGADVLDLDAVTRAVLGCAAVVHLAALAHDTAGSPEQIMAVNVLGTWHVLLAAEAAGVSRVICFSSAQALGILIPERAFQHWAGEAWATEAGSFALSAGPSSASLPLTAQLERG